MSLNVYIPRPHDSEFVILLKEQIGPAITITVGQDMTPPENTNVLIGGVPDPEHLRMLSNLAALVIPFAGVPARTREIMAEFPHISVHNLHHNAIPTAEMAISLMLAARKFVPFYDRRLRRGDWSARYAEATAGLAAGKWALIIGYGAIGRHIAKICLGLGMNVSAARRTDTESDDGDIHLLTMAKMRAALPKTDVLFIAVPLTNETEGLIGRDELALLPGGATVVNIGRGLIVDEAALYSELASGRINAGIDVWYQYPQTPEERSNRLPSELGFEKLDNVVMTPHLAGHSLEIERLRAEAMARLLNAFAAGDTSRNRVNLSRGY